METIDNIKFAEMLTTKFCHDITGPIGAVNNGVEFLVDGDVEMKEQAISLIANSAAEAMVRLQFYRQAYGMNVSDSAVNLGDTRKVVVDFFNQAKPELVWPLEYSEVAGVDMTSLQRKIIMNLLIVAIGCLPRGGQVEFSIGATEFVVSAKGEVIKFGEMELAFLSGNKSVSDVDPRNVQLFYTNQLIKITGKSFNIDSGVGCVMFKLAI